MQLSSLELRALKLMLEDAERHGPVCSPDCSDDCMFAPGDDAEEFGEDG